METAPKPDVLNKEFLARQRVLLQETREAQARVVEALASEIDNHIRRRETGAPPPEGFGTGEIASMDLERAKDQHAQAVARIAEIDAAFTRLDARTYGRCELCGGSIGRARLEAVPVATRCIGCQAGHQRR